MAEEIEKKVANAHLKDKEDVGLSDEQLDKTAAGRHNEVIEGTFKFYRPSPDSEDDDPTLKERESR
jgi:hypothetical protein